MTVVRTAPSLVGRRVDVLGDTHRAELDRLIATDPLVNVVLAARLSAFRTVEARFFGGSILGVRHAPGEPVHAAAFNGGNLLPVGGDMADWSALAHVVARSPRACTSIVGRSAAVSALWRLLEAAWGPARAIRADQPLLVIDDVAAIVLEPDPRVRLMVPADLVAYLPAAAAMFVEELGVSPYAGAGGPSYRRRIEALIGTRRAFGVRDERGRVIFKADIGALTQTTCQLQGVWVAPDLRGRGVGSHALAGVLHAAMRLAPSVSLYVNDFNLPARRMYERLGMRQVASLATVLF